MSNERVDVLGVLARDLDFLRTIRADAESNDETTHARDAVAELIEAARPHVAATFEDARHAADEGLPAIWCQQDVLNPCWMPGMATTTPLRHWGYTPEMGGHCLACDDCRLRAALSRIGGADDRTP